MRVYLEVQETVDPEAMIEPDFIRCDITDKSESEIADIKADAEAIMSGKQYTVKRHICSHDEGRPCTLVEA